MSEDQQVEEILSSACDVATIAIADPLWTHSQSSAHAGVGLHDDESSRICAGVEFAC